MKSEDTTAASWQESDDKPRQRFEKQSRYSADKGPCSLCYGLPSGQVWLWTLDCKEGRMPKNWYLWTRMLEKTPDGETMETVTDFIYLGSKITADGDCSHEIKGCLLLGRKGVTNLDSIFKSRDIANKGPSSQSYGFSSSHVWMWEVVYKESWAQNCCFWTVVMEKTLESPLDSKEIQPVHLKGNQSWIFIGRTDAEAEIPILWPPEWRTDSFGKTLMLGKIEGRRKRG